MRALTLPSAHLAIAAAALVIAASPASAITYLGPTPYLQFADSPFSGGAFDYFHLEDFEDGALNTPGLSSPAGIVVTPSATIDSVDEDVGGVDGSGANGHSYYADRNENTLIFIFDAVTLGSLPTHAGVVWTDVGFNTSQDVTFQAFDAGDNPLGLFGPFTLGDASVSGETDEDRFFGAIHGPGISRIEISMPGSVDWEVDHVQYGRQAHVDVAAPAAAALIPAGLIGLGFVARRRSRHA